MKKLFATLAVAAFVFAACGTKSNETESTTVETPAEQVQEIAPEVVETPTVETPAAQ